MTGTPKVLVWNGRDQTDDGDTCRALGTEGAGQEGLAASGLRLGED
jgi:hypothetical protein